MPKQPSKMKSWQFFAYARKHLGNSFLYAIFGKKNARSIDYWCQNTITTAKEDGAYDPILGLKNLLAALDDYGHVGTILACIDFLLSDTSLNCGSEAKIIEPLPTITEEVLADYAAVAAMQEAIAREQPPHTIMGLKNAAIAEIERTYAKYREDFRS